MNFLFKWLYLDRSYPDSRIRLMYHTLFWLVVAGFIFSQLYSSVGYKVPLFMLSRLVGLIMCSLLIAYYLLSLFAFPALQQQNYGKTCFALLVAYVVTTTLYFYGIPIVIGSSSYYLHLFQTYSQKSFLSVLTSYQVFLYNWSFSFSMLLLPLMAKGFKLHFLLRYEKQALDQENAKLEIHQLKAQIQPHFILNTLHNLYAIALERNEELADYILRVSELLHYQSKSNKDAALPIAQELEFISHYISLQKLRFRPDFPLTFSVQLAKLDFEIYPFLLITCIENAFRHGISPRGEYSWIDISIQISEQGTFSLLIRNSAFDSSYPPGEGLCLTRKRLALLYPNRHRLDCLREKNSFTTQLCLTL